jgi:MFS family permease
MFATLRQRNFALVWSGGLISLLGDWMLVVGLPLYVYALTGSTLATGTVFIAGQIPRVLLGSVAGVFVDRWDRRHTMIATDLMLALCLLPLLAVHSADRLWVVYVVSFAESSIVQFYRPAEGALLPRLVEADRLVSADSLNALSENIAPLAGPPLGGFAFGLIALNGVVLIDAASFLIAGILVALIHADGRPERLPDAPAPDMSSHPWIAAWREWLAGLRLISATRLVTALFAFAAITGIGEGVLSTLFVPYVRHVLGGTALQYGWILSGQAVGGLIGSIVIGRFASGAAPARLLGVGAVLLGIIDLAIFSYPLVVPGVWPAIALMIVVGLPAAAMVVGYVTVLQTAAPDAYRGRLIGAFGTTGALTRLIGAALAGALGDRLGIIPSLTIQGAGYVFAGILVLQAFRTAQATASATDTTRPHVTRAKEGLPARSQ